MVTIESLFQRNKSKDAKQVEHPTEFSGINDLQTLPDVNQVSVDELENQELQIVVESSDGYTIQVTLRKPEDTDFQSNTAKVSEATDRKKLVVAGEIVVIGAQAKLNMLEALQQKYPSMVGTTIALEASTAHLSKAKNVSDVFVRNMLYASRYKANPTGHTSNFIESKSVSIDVVPHSDLSIFFLVHELIELSLRNEQHSERLTAAATTMWSAYDAAREIAVSKGNVDQKEAWQSVIKKLIQISSSLGEESELLSSAQKFTVEYGKYRLIQHMEAAEQERLINTLTVSFLTDFLPDLSADADRLTRLQTVADITTRGYDMAVQQNVRELIKKNFFIDQSISFIQHVQSFLASRSYESPASELDVSMETWKKLAKALYPDF